MYEQMTQPWPKRLLFLLIATILFASLDLRNTLFSVICSLRRSGDPASSGWHGRIAIAIVISALLAINIAIVKLLPFSAQVFIVWVELLLLALAFFYSFDLSFPFYRFPDRVFNHPRRVYNSLYLAVVDSHCLRDRFNRCAG